MTSFCVRQEELVFLKALWDMVATVMRTFADWCATVWDAIAVDDLVEAAKQLTKDLKTLPKPCRAYDVYRCAWLQRSCGVFATAECLAALRAMLHVLQVSLLFAEPILH